MSNDNVDPLTVSSTHANELLAVELHCTFRYHMWYSRIMPCVSLRGGGLQVTCRLVELVFETFMLVGPAVGAKTDRRQSIL